MCRGSVYLCACIGGCMRMCAILKVNSCGAMRAAPSADILATALACYMVRKGGRLRGRDNRCLQVNCMSPCACACVHVHIHTLKPYNGFVPLLQRPSTTARVTNPPLRTHTHPHPCTPPPPPPSSPKGREIVCQYTQPFLPNARGKHTQMPFRTAHGLAGMAVKAAEDKGCALSDLALQGICF